MRPTPTSGQSKWTVPAPSLPRQHWIMPRDSAATRWLAAPSDLEGGWWMSSLISNFPSSKILVPDPDNVRVYIYVNICTYPMRSIRNSD